MSIIIGEGDPCTRAGQLQLQVREKRGRGERAKRLRGHFAATNKAGRPKVNCGVSAGQLGLSWYKDWRQDGQNKFNGDQGCGTSFRDVYK